MKQDEFEIAVRHFSKVTKRKVRGMVSQYLGYYKVMYRWYSVTHLPTGWSLGDCEYVNEAKRIISALEASDELELFHKKPEKIEEQMGIINFILEGLENGQD